MFENDIPRPEERPEDRIAAEAGRQFGLITRRRCRELGMSDAAIARRLRRGAWSSQAGVLLLPGHPSIWEQRIMLALLRGGAGTAASHRTAAALLHLDGLPPGVVEVYARSLKAYEGMRVHRTTDLPTCDVMSTGPLVHTNASRTLLDLGSVVSQDEVEIALECALRRGLASVPRLLWRLDEIGGRGRPGAATLRKLLDLRRRSTAPADSVLEVRFIQRLRGAKLPLFVRQYEVRVGSGRRRLIDFAYPHALVGIEVGGRRFHAGPAAEQRDATRHNELTSLGWRLLYFTWDDIERRVDYVIECIRHELQPALNVERSLGRGVR